jgi:pyruvate dehydrogenase E2 component (dihydrolipoamide acetyltransferase)
VEPGLKGETIVQEPTRGERAIGRRTAEARATIPDLEFGIDAGVDAALALAERLGCPLTAVLVKACAAALRLHPRANAAYRDGRFELYSRVNVAVTMQTADGYAAPTVLDADAKSTDEVAAELRSFAARARDGELTPPQLAGATFTLTDFGDTGVTRASPIIVPPQAAALAAGAIQAMSAVGGPGTAAGRRVTALTLGCDSRILFGAQAAAFLASVAEHLEHPER